MDLTLLTSLLGARQSATRDAMALSMVKKQHEMELNMIEMLTEVAQSAPPPGQGTHLDTLA
jgi:hypothetical protein